MPGVNTVSCNTGSTKNTRARKVLTTLHNCTFHFSACNAAITVYYISVMSLFFIYLIIHVHVLQDALIDRNEFKDILTDKLQFRTLNVLVNRRPL